VTPKTLKTYLEKSGDSYIHEDNLIENEHGFMSWKIHENDLVLLNVYGDGEYWDVFSNQLAKEFKKKKIIIATRRNPKAFEKKFNYKLTGYILEKEVEYNG